MIHAQRALTTVTEAEHSLLWHLIRYPDVKSPFIVSFHELGKEMESSCAHEYVRRCPSQTGLV